MSSILPLIILIALVIGVFVLFRSKPLFVVEIDNGRANLVRGKVSPVFLRECEEIAKMFDIPKGRISGVPARSGPRLQFSGSIPAQYHQNFRNAWNLRTTR